MPADLQDKWRDEDGVPSPQEELTEWWLKLEPPAPSLPDTSYPHDHSEYLKKLYDEIATLRARVEELEDQAAPAAKREAG